MQSPQSYVEEKLSRLAQDPSDIRPLKGDDLTAHIAKALLSKKFRKFAVGNDYLLHIHNAIHTNIQKNEPIKVVMAFGRYKLWRLEEAPEADWAELFSLMFYTSWLKPIAACYEPGVWFDFSSDDVILERLNNISKAETEAYAKSFDAVIQYVGKYIPKNFHFTVTPVSSRYKSGEFDRELDMRIKQYMDNNRGVFPTLTPEDIALIDLNARPTQEQLKDPLWREKNKVMHDAYMTVSQRRPYYRTEDKILAFTNPLAKGITVGTTKTSVAKFWAGVGALKTRGDTYIETVLSPEQVKTTSFVWAPMQLSGLEGKNFSKVRVVG